MKRVNRRNFLKYSGLGFSGIALGSSLKLMGHTTDGLLVESEKEYGGFSVEKLSGSKVPYELDPARIRKMDELNTIFSRNVWDPGRLASAACGDGYSRMAVTAFKLAEFIRALGYRALPAGNGVGLSIPIAIDAGMGELGRNGLLVTPKYWAKGQTCKGNKRHAPDSWLHKITRDAIKLRSISLDKLMVRLDQASGYGEQVDSGEFWKRDGLASITAREPI